MITITNIAKQKLKNLITTNSGKSALLYLKGGGCNGFNYVFSVLNEDKKPNKLDEIYNLDNEHNLYICNKSLMYILGTHIDWKQDIMEQKFVFSNPLAKSKCGCGTSFNI